MSNPLLQVALLGAGRIGTIHAANLAAHPNVRLKVVADPDLAAAQAVATRHGATAAEDPLRAINDPEVQAVVIASPTPTHVSFIVAAARAGKAIFCEKPIDLDLGQVDLCLDEVRSAGVPLFIGFNRRFDPSFRTLHQRVRDGAVGKVEQVTIISRDPGPPPAQYAKASGGIFRDMTIHDFDMARWLIGEEPTELFASASALVDPDIGREGDYDTVMITLRTASGVLCHIQNSRRATYGYDQRVEVFGDKGLLQLGNPGATTVSAWSADGITAERPLDFFLQRYVDAYRLELEHFVLALETGRVPEPGPGDGRQALVLAEAALESARSGRLVRVPPPPGS